MDRQQIIKTLKQIREYIIEDEQEELTDYTLENAVFSVDAAIIFLEENESE